MVETICLATLCGITEDFIVPEFGCLPAIVKEKSGVGFKISYLLQLRLGISQFSYSISLS